MFAEFSYTIYTSAVMSDYEYQPKRGSHFVISLLWEQIFNLFLASFVTR